MAIEETGGLQPMPIDPTDDPFAQRRDAVTARDWHLRPAPDRHWLLWLVLAVLLVFAAWQGTEWLLARPGSAVQVPSAVRPPSASSPSPANARVAPDVAARPAPPESIGVTNCLTAAGKAEYSDGPSLPDRARPRCGCSRTSTWPTA